MSTTGERAHALGILTLVYVIPLAVGFVHGEFPVCLAALSVALLWEQWLHRDARLGALKYRQRYEEEWAVAIDENGTGLNTNFVVHLGGSAVSYLLGKHALPPLLS